MVLHHNFCFCMKAHFKCKLSSSSHKKVMKSKKRGFDSDMLTRDNSINEDEEESQKNIKSKKEQLLEQRNKELSRENEKDLKKSDICSTQASFRDSQTKNCQKQNSILLQRLKVEQLKEIMLKQTNYRENLIQFLEYVMEYKLGSKEAYQPKEQKVCQKRKKYRPVKETIRKGEIKIHSYDSFENYQEIRSDIQLINYGYQCDGCSMNPIQGLRYHCPSINCNDDFDLCESCYRRTNHRHSLLKIETNLIKDTIKDIKPSLFGNRSQLEKTIRNTTQNFNSSIY